MGIIILLYGVVVYLLMLLAFLYLVPFIGGEMVSFVGAPWTLDAGGPVAQTGTAALVNIGLLLLFAIPHTIMARKGFKKALTRIIPPSAERSTYVLVTTLILALVYTQWRPMPEIVWDVQSPVGVLILTSAFFLGFGLVFLVTFLINHFELFGLMQVWYRFREKPMPEPTFRTPFLYRVVRHPLYLGWIVMFWATPHMTVGHLLFASIWTIYIFIAMGYEDRDLVELFGDRYRVYLARVPTILPFGARKD